MRGEGPRGRAVQVSKGRGGRRGERRRPEVMGGRSDKFVLKTHPRTDPYWAVGSGRCNVWAETLILEARTYSAIKCVCIQVSAARKQVSFPLSFTYKVCPATLPTWDYMVNSFPVFEAMSSMRTLYWVSLMIGLFFTLLTLFLKWQ